MATVDLTIRGAGIFGLSIAWSCLRKGARVRIIDPLGIGGGSSGGLVGALAPHTPDAWNDLKQFQFESLVMAEAFWAEIETVSGMTSGYARTGRLQPLAGTKAIERARHREIEAETNWGAAATWRVVDAGDLDGWVPVAPSGLMIADTLSARLHPRRALDAIAAAIRSRGGMFGTEADNEGAVVWATGWQGLRELSVDLGADIGTGVKGQALTVRASAPTAARQIYADGLHIVPHTDGTVAVGSTTERDFEDPASTDGQLDDLLDRATAVLPILHGAPVVARWAGVRPRAATRAPLLGHWPGRDGHYIANGGFKIGFGIAPKVADAMARLILEDEDTIPPALHIEASL